MKKIIENYVEYLNDESNFYTEPSLRKAMFASAGITVAGITGIRIAKKIENAENSYARNVSASNLLVFLDATIFGSADNGFCLTDTHFAFKSTNDDDGHRIPLSQLKTVRLYLEDTELVVNGKVFYYGNKSLGKKMEIISACLKEYIAKYN